MKSIAIIVAALLSSCVIGVDERGDWNIRPDPLTIDKGLAYLIRHEGGSKDADVAYFDYETGELIPPDQYHFYEIEE